MQIGFGNRDGRRWIALGMSLFAFMHASGTALGEEPRRIVSLSPNLTQTIFALGAGERVVGVGDFCNDPPAALRLPRVGGWSNPNYEVITALEPDLIVVLGRHEKVAEFARRRKIPLAQIPMDSVATIRSGTLELGRLLVREDAATSLTARFDAQLADFRRQLERHAGRPRARVYLSLTRKPGSLADLFTASGDSFLDEALRLAGGENIFHDVKQRYPQVSKESLVARCPEAILEIEAGARLSESQRRQLVDDWRGLSSIPAVRDGRIEILTDDILLLAGPRFPEIVEQLRKALWGAS